MSLVHNHYVLYFKDKDTHPKIWGKKQQFPKNCIFVIAKEHWINIFKVTVNNAKLHKIDELSKLLDDKMSWQAY